MPPDAAATTTTIRPSRWLSGAIVVGFVGLYAWFFVNAANRIGTESELGDFYHFYYGARAMADHQDIYASWRGGYIYPPLLAFVLMPVALLPLQAAAVLMLLVNIGLSLLTIRAGARECVDRFAAPATGLTVGGAALLGTLLTTDKIKGELQMWQTNVVMLLMLTVALRWLDRRPWLAGLALGFAFNIKYLAVVMLPYLLLRRRWRAAGGFIAGIVGFALLPAVWTGWSQNLHDLGVAAAGLLRLLGIDAGPGPAANVSDMEVGFSVSVTSAIARAIRTGGSTLPALALAGLLAGATIGVAAWMYRKNRVPVVDWPGAAGQGEQPYRAVVALEWVGLIAFALAFSPQTNTRHLYLLLLVQILAAVLLLFGRRGVSRVPVLVGLVVLFCGLNLPPGGPTWDPQVRWWRVVGGPSWCLLAMYACTLWTGLRYATALKAGAPLQRAAAA